MPAAIRDIVKSVLQYLKENKLNPTPENYKKVFYEQAVKHGFDMSDCDRLSAFANKLNEEEIIELNEKNIVDIDSLFDYVVDKLREKEKSILHSPKEILSKSTVEKIASLMISSLAPVFVNENLDKDINSLTKILKGDLHNLNKNEVQNNIEEYILKRKQSDKNAITDKTEKLNNLVNNMDHCIEDTVSLSEEGAKKLDIVLAELNEIEVNGENESLEVFKNKMIDINNNIKDLVTKLANNLISEQNEVVILKKKVLKLEDDLRDAKVESSTDFLTGAYTRREFNTKIKELNVNYNKHKKDFSIAYIDLDFFKNVNDKYGHDAGDIVLSTFSRVLMKKIAQKGEVYRYGGEEFVVLLPNISKDEVKKEMINVKNQINKSKFIYEDKTIKITFSAGVALRSEHRRVDDFVKEADRLLYKAKADGRNIIYFN